MELKISDFATVNELNDFVQSKLKGARLDYDRDTHELIIRTGLMSDAAGATTTAR